MMQPAWRKLRRRKRQSWLNNHAAKVYQVSLLIFVLEDENGDFRAERIRRRWSFVLTLCFAMQTLLVVVIV